MVSAFNAGDNKAVAAACTAQTSIIDDFPPHAWQTCRDWKSDFDAYAKKGGLTGGKVTLGTPSHNEVNGDRAYIVIPGTSFAFKVNGKPMAETGAAFTFVLQKSANGWLITSWSWAQLHDSKPVTK